jgi:hypothetical protein
MRRLISSCNWDAVRVLRIMRISSRRMMPMDSLA